MIEEHLDLIIAAIVKTELQMYWLSLTSPYKLRLFSTV